MLRICIFTKGGNLGKARNDFHRTLKLLTVPKTNKDYEKDIFRFPKEGFNRSQLAKSWERQRAVVRALATEQDAKRDFLRKRRSKGAVGWLISVADKK